MEPHESKEELEPRPLRPWRKVLAVAPKVFAVALGFLGLFFTFARDAEHLRAYNDGLSFYLQRLSPDKLLKELMKEESSCYLDVGQPAGFFINCDKYSSRARYSGICRRYGSDGTCLKETCTLFRSDGTCLTDANDAAGWSCTEWPRSVVSWADFTCIGGHVIIQPGVLLLFVANTLGILAIPVFIFAYFTGIAAHEDVGLAKGFIEFFRTTFVIYISLLICALILYIFTLVFGAVLGFLVSIWAWFGAIATAVLFPHEVHEKTRKLLVLLRVGSKES